MNEDGGVIKTGIEIAKDGLKHRFGDPFFSTFSITFILFNYQIPLYIFSDLDVDTKITKIHQSIGLCSIIFPALLSLFLLLAFPKFFSILYRWLEENRVAIKNIQMTAAQKLQRQLKDRLDEEFANTRALTQRISEKDQLLVPPQFNFFRFCT